MAFGGSLQPLVGFAVWLMLGICLVAAQTNEPTTTNTSTAPDSVCTPERLTVRISDDEELGCQHPYLLNITCSNWKYGEEMKFNISRWRFSSAIVLETQYPAYPDQLRLCVYRQIKDHFQNNKGPLSNYTSNTTLNVFNRQQDKMINVIPLTFEFVEVNDPPRITYPADIYVTEARYTGAKQWNITYTDPDDWKTFPSNYSIYSPDIPEQLKINKTTWKMGTFTVQAFTLWYVKPFDADIFPSQTFGPREDFGMMKRSAVDRDSYKRRTRTSKKKTNDIESLQSRKQSPYKFPRVKRENGFGPTTNFTIRVADQTGLGTEFAITVHISDINDNQPVCSTPDTIAIARDVDMQHPLFELSTICSDPDYHYENQIRDYRLSNMNDCLGRFRISPDGSLSAVDRLLLRNMSSCEFDVVAMDTLYATSVHLKLVFGECEASVDARGALWNVSQPGRWQYMPCPQGYTGTVSRYCNSYATYDPAVYACTSEIISNISRKMRDLRYEYSSNISISPTLYELKKATDRSLMVGDITTVFNTLRTATYIVRYRNINDWNKTEAFLDVANNLLKDHNDDTWKSTMYKSSTGAEQLTETLDDYIKYAVLADRHLYTRPQEYTKDNLMVSLGPLSSCTSDMEFPNRTTSTPDWIKQSDNKIRLQCSGAGKNNFFSSTFYKDISNLVSPTAFSKSLENTSLNSAVISFSLFPEQPRRLDPPIEVTFEVINAGLKDPQCSYWKPSNSYGGHGYWATDGCTLKSYSNGVVTCLCDHLTNFAVLMSPADHSEIHTKHTEALSVISLVGCIISMLCLLVTVGVYIFYWRVIKSERSAILLNLCITLFIAYLVFLAGVNQTADKVLCRVIAIFLHFIYLEVFLTMLVQGINLALTVLRPLKKQRFGWQMIVASYGTSILIVAISMGSTELKGYGNEKFCWLSVDSGLIWTFVIPVLFVIVANIVIVVIVLRGMFGTAALKKKTDKEKLRAGIRSLLILMPVIGITWIFGIFAVNRETVVFQYFFAIFNSIQGLLIFIFHCALNKKIQEAFKKTRAQLFASETGTTSTGERIPMKSDVTADTMVK